MTIDICIIGAGVSGLYAANECKRRGLSYRLLERTDRVGGLVKTCDMKGGRLLEKCPIRYLPEEHRIIDSIVKENNIPIQDEKNPTQYRINGELLSFEESNNIASAYSDAVENILTDDNDMTTILQLLRSNYTVKNNLDKPISYIISDLENDIIYLDVMRLVLLFETTLSVSSRLYKTFPSGVVYKSFVNGTMDIVNALKKDVKVDLSTDVTAIMGNIVVTHNEFIKAKRIFFCADVTDINKIINGSSIPRLSELYTRIYIRLNHKWKYDDIRLFYKDTQFLLWKWDDNTVMVYGESVDISVVEYVKKLYNLNIERIYPTEARIYFNFTTPDRVINENIYLTSSSMSVDQSTWMNGGMKLVKKYL
jgi:hypothetical protein